MDGETESEREGTGEAQAGGVEGSVEGRGSWRLELLCTSIMQQGANQGTPPQQLLAAALTTGLHMAVADHEWARGFLREIEPLHIFDQYDRHVRDLMRDLDKHARGEQA